MLFKFQYILNENKNFKQLRDEAARFLLDEAFLDLDTHFNDLITTKWMNTSISIDTICVTLEDYFQDYIHLRVRNFDYVISEAQNLVAKRYITSMLQKKLTFRSYDERKEAAIKIIKESKQIKTLFDRIAPKVAKFDSPFEIINTLAEVLKSEDPEILSLDLHCLLDKYPDVTQTHLINLLILRGDISRSDAKEKVQFILQNNKSRQNKSLPKSIFSQIK